ncbi:hypothetical protein C0J52_24895 [Blattella germanica]|nr:hypothetical protein C0J52_24895 [Blattella germanica]
MREDRLPKKDFEWKSMGRRKRGRPNITWTEGILKTMRERRLQEGDWEDREENVLKQIRIFLIIYHE